jgi:hypothetical protein
MLALAVLLCFCVLETIIGQAQTINSIEIGSSGLVNYGATPVFSTGFENVVANYGSGNPINFTNMGLVYVTSGGSGGSYWIEGANKITPGFTPYDGSRCMGLNTTSTSNYRSQMDWYIYDVLGTSDAYYVSFWEYLPSNYLTTFNSISVTGGDHLRWMVIGGDLVQDDSYIGYFPQIELHLEQNSTTPSIYQLHLDERLWYAWYNGYDIGPIAVVNNFNASSLAGKWFNVAWYVHEDSSLTINSTGMIVPNGDSQIIVWLNGQQTMTVSASQMPIPIPQNNIAGLYSPGNRANTIYNTIGKIYWGDGSPNSTTTEFIDDVQIWNIKP